MATATQNTHKKKTFIDLLILTLITIVIVLISISIDIHEKLVNSVKTYESWEVDDIFTSGALCLLFGFIWFTWRRLQDSRQTNMMINNSENRYRSLIDSTDNSIFIVDRNYNYLYISEKHLARIGVNKNQYMGQPFSAFHSPKETNYLLKKRRRCSKQVTQCNLHIRVLKKKDITFRHIVLLWEMITNQLPLLL